jgi:hypothetical protein
VTVADLDDVTYDLEVDGEEVRRTIDRRVWERGGWATVAIAYQERGKDGAWSGKVVLLRMKRAHDTWVKHATITLRGAEALELGARLASWQDALAGDSDDD